MLEVDADDECDHGAQNEERYEERVAGSKTHVLELGYSAKDRQPVAGIHRTVLTFAYRIPHRTDSRPNLRRIVPARYGTGRASGKNLETGAGPRSIP